MINIDYDKLNIDLLPTELRTTKQIEWIKSLSIGTKDIKDEIDNYFDSIYFDVTHTGQVLSLEHYLNIHFGLPWPKVLPDSIYITDGSWLDEAYTFNKGDDANSSLNNFGIVNPNDPYDGQYYSFNDNEGASTITDIVYLYSDDEFDTDTVDFIIHVYSGWIDTNRENKIREITNYFKKVGKTYKIVIY